MVGLFYTALKMVKLNTKAKMGDLKENTQTLERTFKNVKNI